MNLEERMEFRREMLYEAIRITMQAHGILSASYRFRVVRNDRRGHMYSVMMDLSTDFMHNRKGCPAQLVALGMAIGKNAAARYGILVSGVYWRVNDQIQGFEPSRPDAEFGADATAPALPPPRPRHERAGAEELAAFEAAWQKEKAQELRLRDRVYASDLAPLGDLAEGVSRR
ncbi:MAG TPA: hypothetical protein PK060_20350 [Polaromonas sp.]|jgi:hypothetical protein|nr:MULTISPECIES: hypothetical protein [unclassified Polaromonas]HQR98639.1 hypothetical protein [Polaromonas sp.]HQS41025.1 hypothetical protein [Polaromonas sp.]HQS86835.1 hypothetical protein [Polaromonas sp.]HQT09568.1 hypothetical protein [Polaromonas sp.]